MYVLRSKSINHKHNDQLIITDILINIPNIPKNNNQSIIYFVRNACDMLSVFKLLPALPLPAKSPPVLLRGYQPLRCKILWFRFREVLFWQPRHVLPQINWNTFVVIRSLELANLALLHYCFFPAAFWSWLGSSLLFAKNGLTTLWLTTSRNVSRIFSSVNLIFV